MDFMKWQNLESIYLPFPGDKNIRFCGFSLISTYNDVIFLRRAPSYDVKYLSNNLNNPKNGFYEGKNPKIHIFTIFRRQKHKILWIFFNFYIKWRHFLTSCSVVQRQIFVKRFKRPQKGILWREKNWNPYIYHFYATKN